MCAHGQIRICRVWISAEDSHTGAGHWAEKAVDACIADFVNALNSRGLLTRTCCCGHGKQEGSIVLQDGTIIPIAFFQLSPWQRNILRELDAVPPGHRIVMLYGRKMGRTWLNEVLKNNVFRCNKALQPFQQEYQCEPWKQQTTEKEEHERRNQVRSVGNH